MSGGSNVATDVDIFSSAVGLARQIRDKDVSPVEVASAYLERIEAVDGDVNAFVWRNDEQVMEAARAAEAAVMAGGDLPPFLGVPIPVKGLSDVAGQPNDLCSLAIDPAPRPDTDPCVVRFQQAGFILMGRTNSPEFGALTATENAKYGKTRNPWDLSRTPGGSSGGAAAAVAAGMAPLAHASDGGGSIRVPSSCCGLVGLKTSRGRIPQMVVGWEHSTVEGVVTRTVEDTAAALDALAGIDLGGWYSAPAPPRPFRTLATEDPGRLRIGLLLDAPTRMPVDPECATAARIAADALASMGHEVVQAAPVLFSKESIDHFQTIISAWTGANEITDPSLCDPYIRHRIAEGHKLTAVDYARASTLMQLETREILAQWGRDFDVLLTPTMATPTPPVGLVYDEANDNPTTGERETEIRMISFTSFCNMSGQPAISLPVHMAADGMPVGAQLVGAPFREDQLLQLASGLESVLGWERRTAPSPPETRT